MRMESDKPSKNVMGGWLHRLNGNRKLFIQSQPRDEKPVSFEEMRSTYDTWQAITTTEKLCECADSLGVSIESLISFGWRWTGYAWAIPMHSPKLELVGIRLRAENGKKWSVKGSHQGLFISLEQCNRMVMITEGPTDAAAAMTMNFFACGRPSCSTGEQMIVDFIRLWKIHRAIIVSDNDEPGLRGSEKLQKAIKIPSMVWVPQAKDLRDYLRNGGTREMIESQIKDVVWETNSN